MGSHRLPNKKSNGNYLIRMEISIIVVLALMTGLFKMDIRADEDDNIMADQQETVKMEEIVQTEHEKEPPLPPRPQVPVEVPNDEIVDEAVLDLNSELSMGDKLSIPPPPESTDEKPDDEQVFVVVQTPPELIGGYQELQQKISYPEVARQAGIEGRVYVQFIVDEKGNVQNPRVVRGIGGGCDKEAIRVVSQARFKPGLQRGHPVKVRYSMPIVFQLDRSS